MRGFLRAVRRLRGRSRTLVVLENSCNLAEEALLFLPILLSIRFLPVHRLWLRHHRLFPTPKQPRKESLHSRLLLAGIPRLRPRHKRRSIVVRTRGRRQPVRRLVQLHIHYPGRLGKRLHVGIFWESRRFFHELRPDRRRRLRPAQSQVAIVVVSHPHNAQQVRRVSRKPPIVRTARLSRSRWSKSPQPDSRISQPVIDDSFHHVRHHIGNARIHYLPLIRVVIRDHVALAIAHRPQQDRRQP